MEHITSAVLEDILTYNNEINCVRDTIGPLQNTDILVVSNIENGSSASELVDPFLRLFHMASEKCENDIEYVMQKKSPIEVNVNESFQSLNVYDLDQFLQALVPDQTCLIETLTDQCNIHPQFSCLVQKLHLLRKPCSRHSCQAKILAGSKFMYGHEDENIRFPIAHPPFVYEIGRLLKQANFKTIETYLQHLHRYLTSEIEVDSCILCLTFDLYCKCEAPIKNFRLFFLEKNSKVLPDPNIGWLYEAKLETDQNNQYSLFDEVLDNINVVTLSDSGKENRYIIRYVDKKKNKTELYF